jgi:hypothetical protein
MIKHYHAPDDQSFLIRAHDLMLAGLLTQSCAVWSLGKDFRAREDRSLVV